MVVRRRDDPREQIDRQQTSCFNNVRRTSTQLNSTQELTLIADGRLEVDVDSPGDVPAGAGLGEEGVVRVVGHAQRLVGAHGPVRLDPVLQTVQLPALVPGLDPGLAEVDRDALCRSSTKNGEARAR